MTVEREKRERERAVSRREKMGVTMLQLVFNLLPVQNASSEPKTETRR